MNTSPDVCVPNLCDFRVDRWLVQPGLNRIVSGDTSIRLRPQLIDVLACLADRPGAVVTKDQLLATVWRDRHVCASGIARCVAELRLALADDARAPRIIQTISKRGYRLIATVEHTGVCHASVGHALAPSGSSQPPTHHPTDGAPWSDQISEFGPRTRSLFSTTLELVARWRRHAAQPAE